MTIRSKNKQFQGPYQEKEVDLFTLSCVDSTGAFTVKVPLADSYEISMGARFVTSTGAASAAAAGDDSTLLVSVDGVNFHPPGTVAGTAVVLGADDNGVVIITDTITHIRASAAQLAADETQVHNIVCVTN